MRQVSVQSSLKPDWSSYNSSCLMSYSSTCSVWATVCHTRSTQITHLPVTCGVPRGLHLDPSSSLFCPLAKSSINMVFISTAALIKSSFLSSFKCQHNRETKTYQLEKMDQWVYTTCLTDLANITFDSVARFIEEKLQTQEHSQKAQWYALRNIFKLYKDRYSCFLDITRTSQNATKTPIIC